MFLAGSLDLWDGNALVNTSYFTNAREVRWRGFKWSIEKQSDVKHLLKESFISSLHLQ